MKKLIPTQRLLDSFQSYRAKTNCSKCHQTLPIEQRKPAAEFFLLKEMKDGRMLKVQMTGRKTKLVIHRDFFEPLNSDKK